MHRLLCLSRLDSSASEPMTTTANSILACIRHATLLHLQPLRRAFGILTDISSATHLAHLRTSLSSLSRHQLSPWRPLPTLHQWVLVSGGLEASSEAEQRWFARQLAACEGFREPEGGEFGAVVRGFVWVGEVGDEGLGRVVWQALEEMGE